MQWQRWNSTDTYHHTDLVEVLYVDDKNQVCLRKEKTKDIDWNRSHNIILAWRPIVIQQPKPVKKEPQVIMVKYWNYVTRKYWSSDKVIPNPKLPNYLKLTFTLTDGKMDVKYEMHSKP